MLIRASDARIKTKYSAIYKIFIDRIGKDIEMGMKLGRYEINVSSRILGECDDLIKVPYEVMKLALEELEKLGYKARISNDKELLEIHWED